MQCNQVIRAIVSDQARLMQRDAPAIAPLLRSALASGNVDENSPHRFGRGGEEVSAPSNVASP